MCEIERVQSCLCVKKSCLMLHPQSSLLKLDTTNSNTKDDNAPTTLRTGLTSFCGAYGDSESLPEYYKSPIAEIKLTRNRMSSYVEESVLEGAIKNLHKKYYCLQNVSERFQNKGTQSIYRESECQTTPWEPPYTVKPGHNPEVLTLAHLTWGNGLPAGMHEIQLINRMRMKKAWEKILPPMDTPANIKIRTACIAALEADDWAHREAEIQFINNLRMELAEKLMQSHDKERKMQLEVRLKKLDESLYKRKQREIKNIRTKFSRELRKLANKHRSVKMQHSKRDIIKRHLEKDLDYHFPNPSHNCSKMMHKQFTKEDFINRFDNDEIKLPNWLSPKRKSTYIGPKPFKQFCWRKLERNEKKLQDITIKLEHLKLKAESSDPRNLLKLKPKTPTLPSTPRRWVDEAEIDNEVEQAASLVQNLVKGRALQCTITEGRNRYGELIEELQSIKALERAKDLEGKSHLNLLQQEEETKALQESRVNEILEALEGKTIVKMLTVLSDELERLEGEKKAHALALLAERERIKREIAEASKEQLEVNRRREFDEMYRQILKVNQESVETYLEDIIKEGIEWHSEKEAEKYIIDLADKTDAVTRTIEENSEKINEEGMVSDMVYNFVLPEVEKELVRKKLRDKQKSYLCAAHASIYDEILNLPDDELLTQKESTARSSSSSFSEKFTHDNSELEQSDELETSNIFDDDEDSISNYDKDAFEHEIQIILSYAMIPNENDEQEVHEILKQVFRDVKNKANDLTK